MRTKPRGRTILPALISTHRGFLSTRSPLTRSIEDEVASRRRLGGSIVSESALPRGVRVARRLPARLLTNGRNKVLLVSPLLLSLHCAREEPGDEIALNEDVKKDE